LGIGLAAATTALPVRAINLHNPDALGVKHTGQPSPIRAGALDPDEFDLAEAREPIV
jgi:hypothetical protein